MDTCLNARTLARLHRQRLTWSLVAASLVACGGGGSDAPPTGTAPPPPAPAPGPSPSPSPGPAPSPSPGPQFNKRIQSAAYDYDNNGTTDATETMSYDVAGRLSSRVYTYRGDSTPDAEAPLGNKNYTETITYDGTTLRASRVVVSIADGSGYTLDFTYDISGRPVRQDIVSRAPGGGVADEQYALISYSGGVPTLITRHLKSSGDEILREQLSYDASGRPELLVRSSGASFSQRLAFQWNADGTLARHTLDANNDGTVDETHMLTYSSSRLVRTLQVNSGLYAAQPGRDHLFSYDGNGALTGWTTDIGSNGSIELRMQVQPQSGLCGPVVVPIAFPTVTFNGYGANALQEFNFCLP